MKFPRPRLLGPGEARATWVGFAFLAAFFAGQAVLEAARDTLFLSKVPAAHLPWMYIIIAVLSFMVARGEERLGRRMDSADALVIWVAIAALGTGGLALVGQQVAGVYATYVWSALVTSLVVARFWALLGGLYSITEAKRLYGLIGAGSVIGAIVGSGLASLAAYLAPPETLLLLAAALFVGAAVAANTLRAAIGPSAQLGPAPAPVRLLRAIALFRRDGYPQRVVVMLVLAAAGLTFADYAFKSVVVERVPREQLGVFFGGLGLVCNSLSLVVQVLIGPRLIASLGVCGALVVLPVVLAGGGVGLAIGLGVGAAVGIRVSDGALRYSLHRTAAELLFVPMSSGLRGAMKVLDTLGQRVGQAAASIGLLLLASLGAPGWVVSVCLVAFALTWAVAALELRRYYLDVFRSDLRTGRLGDSVALRGLDQAALETLISVLDSGDDAEVLAALAILSRENKAHLVPGLILYHPSLEVMWTAASLFVRTGRRSIVPILDRLTRDLSEDRRSIAIITRVMLADERGALEALLEAEPSPELRQLLRFFLVRHGVGGIEDARKIVAEVLVSPHPRVRIWMAAAIAIDPSPTHDEALLAIAAEDSPSLRQAIPGLLALKGTPASLSALIALLGDERAREASIRALVARGEAGLSALLGALQDDGRERGVAWHVPRALTHFPSQVVVPALLERMRSAPDGMVRFRCLRAIERVLALDPTAEIDRQVLAEEAKKTVARAVWCLSRRALLQGGATAEVWRDTEAHRLVLALLEDKERHALDRALRLLGLLHRGGDYTDVRRGLASDTPRVRASAVELLGLLLPAELKAPMLALVARSPDAERLEATLETFPTTTPDYAGVLEELIHSGDRNLSDLAAFHREELSAVARRTAPAREAS